MDTKIHFFHQDAKIKFSFPAFITNITDGNTVNFDKITIPFGTERNLYIGNSRYIALSFDVLATTITEARENFKNLSLLQRMISPAKYSNDNTPVNANAKHTRILYQNIIINPNHSPDSDVEVAGLLCTLLKVDVKMQFESGFYVSGQYIYPKLAKVDISLQPDPELEKYKAESPNVSYIPFSQAKTPLEEKNNYWPWAGQQVKKKEQTKEETPNPPAPVVEGKRSPANAREAAAAEAAKKAATGSKTTPSTPIPANQEKKEEKRDSTKKEKADPNSGSPKEQKPLTDKELERNRKLARLGITPKP